MHSSGWKITTMRFHRPAAECRAEMAMTGQIIGIRTDTTIADRGRDIVAEKSCRPAAMIRLRATDRRRWSAGRGLDNTSKFHAAHRWTSTGILQCVRTLTVSLPRTIAEMPWRPCEAITIRSQFFDCAVSMIA